MTAQSLAKENSVFAGAVADAHGRRDPGQLGSNGVVSGGLPLLVGAPG